MRHGAEFAANTEAEYEALASAFCFDEPCPGDVTQYERYCARDGDPKRVRYRGQSSEYAVMVRDTAVLCTYHLLYPVGTRGAPYSHDYATNDQFVAADRECSRKDLGGPHA